MIKHCGNLHQTPRNCYCCCYHRKLFVIPKLGKCWGFFPLLGNVWDNIFLSWEMIGKSLVLFFPMLGSLWKIKQNIF